RSAWCRARAAAGRWSSSGLLDPWGAQPNLETVPETTPAIAEQRRRLPEQRGVYLFKDGRGKVIYVGKARSIRKRVGGHFSGKSQVREISQVAALGFLVTEPQ